jgi:hypothetical protein
MVIPSELGDNTVEMPFKRCPAGFSEQALFIVARFTLRSLSIKPSAATKPRSWKAKFELQSSTGPDTNKNTMKPKREAAGFA